MLRQQLLRPAAARAHAHKRGVVAKAAAPSVQDARVRAAQGAGADASVDLKVQRGQASEGAVAELQLIVAKQEATLTQLAELARAVREQAVSEASGGCAGDPVGAGQPGTL
jgi:hypothetical protein